MTKKKFTVLISVFCLIVAVSVCLMPATSTSSADSVDDLTLLTEQYPPFNFQADGNLQGISIELMEKILEKVGSKLNRGDIELQPWARSYKQVQEDKNVALFAMTRLAERENMFKWMGPLTPTVLGLTAKKSRNIKIDVFDDIKKYQVGVIRAGICPMLLVKRGIQKNTLQEVAETIQNIKKLNIDRIDIWAYETSVAKWELKSNGYDPNDYEVVYVLQEGELWFAFNKETPDATIRVMQDAYDELAKEGECQRIIDKYLK